ncbi:MAG TPA: S41 family peptidase [Flavipsychrobacter sp.]|nr:S41 family peptidase [Flavipsychrobacter sp.]
MSGNNTGKRKVWTPLLFSLILILGMFLGFKLRDILRNKRDIQTIIERNDRLEEVIDLINEKYVDTVNTNVLYKDAMSGILSHLDPHTVYIPADELESVNEDLEGGFFGIGVEFSIVRDTIEVTSLVEGGPAEHAGMEIGDQLIKVGDSVVAGQKITSERIIRMLKGKQYSHVLLTVKQPFSNLQRHINITRDVIPIHSVEASIMLDNVTGFIKIDRFSANTYDEFKTALKELKSQGLQQLIIDLREDPGGFLDAATNIADQFLDDNKLIVYTKGQHSPRQEYRAEKNGMFEKGRLAILVDESSASASEILAGAVQDWDRGVIIGRRTFGKGLVQEQYELDDGSALRLTIAKYYTPSGRCIQRSFAKGKEVYEEDFEKRFQDGELTGKDINSIQDTTRYYTANHRLVYGGGGIKPDVYVPYDTSRISMSLLNMLYSENLKNVLWDYYLNNRAKLIFKNIQDYKERFKAENELASRYVADLKNVQERKVAVKILSSPFAAEYFRLHIKAQMARYLFKDNGYYAVMAQDDNAIQKAMQIIHSDNYLQLVRRQ